MMIYICIYIYIVCVCVAVSDIHEGSRQKTVTAVFSDASCCQPARFMPGERLSIVSGALRPRDAPRHADENRCRRAQDVVIDACGPTADEKRPAAIARRCPRRFAPVLAGDFCKERVALHRTSYLEEKGRRGEELQGLKLGLEPWMGSHVLVSWDQHLATHAKSCDLP